MRRRLVLVVAATTSLVVVAFALPLAALVRDVAHDRAITASERDATALAPVLAVTDDHQLIAAAIARTATGSEGRLAVFVDGEQIGDPTPADPQALSLAQQGSGFARDSAQGAEIYSPVVVSDGSTAVVRARLPTSLLNRGVGAAWAALATIGVVLVVAGCLFADRLARSLTRDAAALAATARALAGGRDARAGPGGVPEIADVGRALNALADRIDELRAAERERVADLSHRLRTPLTVLRLEADRAGIPALSHGVDRLERDITEVVRHARRPLHQGMVEGTCNLGVVARERAAFWAALAEDDGRPATNDLAPGKLSVRLSEDDATAAIDALLTNVFTHTPEGTGYAIELTTSAGRARLVVRDDGPGVADADDRARRGVSGGGSSGLGLDIVRDAATRAGGSVAFERARSGGLQVVLDLPLIDPPS